MELKIPGLTDAMGKLDKTATQMDQLIAGIGEIAELMKEQNELLGKIRKNV